jgi:6-phosphogluconate dehydrogenase
MTMELRMKKRRPMEVGMIGLGKMGLGMTRRLVRDGCRVVVFDSLQSRVRKTAGVGGKPALSLEELVDLLGPPRVLWMMLPAGSAVEVTVGRLRGLLRRGDAVVGLRRLKAPSGLD